MPVIQQRINLMAKAPYVVCRHIDGKYVAHQVTDLMKYAEAEGFHFLGMEDGQHLRAELRGHPKFEELHGPQYGGEDQVRYEDWKSSEFYGG
jgi:hypothetical protein